MDTGRGDAVTSLDPPAYSTGWIARRLGVAAATLRTWHRRYDVGPTGRTVGGHRRYVPRDLDRLERMRRLMLAGLSTAEAARVSVDPSSGPPASVIDGRGADQARAPKSSAATRVRHLTNAAMALDQPVVGPLLTEALQERGVVATWTELVVPVLVGIGERYTRHGGCIAVEHLLTECVRTALSAIIGVRRRWDGYPPVLLACPDQEQHSLPLHALGAALAEIGCPTRILGASVPTDELVAAVRRLAPRGVFLWAQTPATARLADLDALPRRRPPSPIVVGGPGWLSRTPPSSVVRVTSLAEAVVAVTHDFMTTPS